MGLGTRLMPNFMAWGHALPYHDGGLDSVGIPIPYGSSSSTVVVVEDIVVAQHVQDLIMYGAVYYICGDMDLSMGKVMYWVIHLHTPPQWLTPRTN